MAPFLSVLFSVHIFPPCDFMMFLHMQSPNPVPLYDFVTNFENKIGVTYGSNHDRYPEYLQLCNFQLFFEVIRIVPLLVNLIALWSRLKMTCIILSLSALTCILLLRALCFMLTLIFNLVFTSLMANDTLHSFQLYVFFS